MDKCCLHVVINNEPSDGDSRHVSCQLNLACVCAVPNPRWIIRSTRLMLVQSAAGSTIKLTAERNLQLHDL